ncbi:hypothetical protein TorRG33x02_347880 [Trema orientale]|uniref:Uncharacterized protein n=1 Tax=Trema orientale TaxID=63057 RepID=A0A2P5AKW9_TREOI|nr:hypothetical protein TorRG33x02_347880 [Trema orientale]
MVGLVILGLLFTQLSSQPQPHPWLFLAPSSRFPFAIELAWPIAVTGLAMVVATARPTMIVEKMFQARPTAISSNVEAFIPRKAVVIPFLVEPSTYMPVVC